MGNWGIIEKYIFYTNLIILLLILFVPIGTYLITGQKIFLAPAHLLLAIAIGIVQIFLVNKLFRKEIEEFWHTLEDAIDRIISEIKKTHHSEDIKRVREKKEELLLPLLNDKSFSKLVTNLNNLFDEFLDILELNLVKDELVRKLTATLNTKRLARILADNLIKDFEIPAIAIYLKNVRGENYDLLLNKGFAALKPFIEEQYADKVKTLEGRVFEEHLNWKLDKGICDVDVERLLVFKLEPRHSKIIGFVFIGLDGDYNDCTEKLLRTFLNEIGATISLIFENALEHEKSVLLASYDPLTGAYNRQEGLKTLRSMLKRAEIEHRNVCILLLDIDHFKRINDTYGHDVGDIVLKEVVRLVRNSIRNKDMIIRWGGEEFIVVVEDVPPEKAREIAERIRQNIEKAIIVVNEKLKINITVSIGVACSEKEGTYFFEELFNIADKRLYRAKGAGRNIVVAE